MKDRQDEYQNDRQHGIKKNERESLVCLSVCLSVALSLLSLPLSLPRPFSTSLSPSLCFPDRNLTAGMEWNGMT